jgi:hypothetical protein
VVLDARFVSSISKSLLITDKRRKSEVDFVPTAPSLFVAFGDLTANFFVEF